MDAKEIKKDIYDLENESYYLMKSIDALRIKVVPDDSDLQNDYVGPLLAVVANQSKLIYKMAQKINQYTTFKGDLKNDWN